MGDKNKPDEPVIFLKPNSSIVYGSNEVFIPEEYGLLHYEVELCFIVGREGKNIKIDDASSHIAGYAVGIDFTLRDRQSIAKQKGLPWALAKGFDGSCPLGNFISADKVKKPNALDIMLLKNEESVQTGNTKEMIFSCEEILSFASKFMTIEKGDIFMTGTPHGVGEVNHGDLFFAEVAGLPSFELKVFRIKDTPDM
jgi:2-keto-4-pentenoate hydratase/2-oxohepta-3-ene-1,7-dioic acid hydratase in catechol pathway